MRALGVLVLALWLTASGSTAPSTSAASAVEHGDLTAHQYAVAVRVAREQISAQHAHLTGAWAIAVPNTHPRGTTNTGRPCRFGHGGAGVADRLVPQIVVSPPPGATEEQTIVTAMGIRVDAASGEPCLIGVDTGPQHPSPAWTRLS